MTRLVLLAAAAAAVASAVPAQAVILPVCDARLVHAAAGASTTCSTDNTPGIAGATVRRTATVVVAEGVAKVTVTCGYGTYARSSSITVSGVEPRSVSVYEDSSSSCRTTLAAVYANTTAVVTSTFSYAFIGPVA